MSHLDIDGYSHLESPIHRWDPRARIASLFVLIFSIVLLKSLPVALLGLCISLGLLLASRLPFGYVARGIRWPAIFLLPFLLILPLTMDGVRIFDFYGLTFSMEGLEEGTLMMIRGLSAVILVYPLFGSSPFNTTIQAFKGLGLPDVATQIFLFAYRYLFLLHEQFQSMARSMDSKGFVKATDARTARILGSALGMLFVRSYERSDRIYQAMVSKGYRGKLPGSEAFKMEGDDWAKSFLVVGAAFGLHCLEWMAMV